jgi:uncharacterized protein
MSEDVLKLLTQQYIEAQPAGCQQVEFAWQGGEPTLMGLPFFERAVAFQQQLARPGMEIHNTIQTNGSLLNDDWARFLHEHRFLVGLSIDGPRELHDHWRVDRGDQGTFDRVMAGLEVLRKHQVDFNTLTVVHRDNSQRPREVYDFLRSVGSTHMQFIPLVEPNHPDGVSVEPLQYGRFLVGIVDRWLERQEVGVVMVRDIEVQLGLRLGLPASHCVQAKTCGLALAAEHNGDIYSCDHFVTPKHRLGNVAKTHLKHLVQKRAQARFGNNKWTTLPDQCRSCEALSLCHGGCPKDRHHTTSTGEPGLNYLCEGYLHYFRHTERVMESMAKALRSGDIAENWSHYR